MDLRPSRLGTCPGSILTLLHWGGAVHQLPSCGNPGPVGCKRVRRSSGQRPRPDNLETRIYALFVLWRESIQKGPYRVQPLLNLVIGFEMWDLTSSGCLNPPDTWIWLYLTFWLFSLTPRGAPLLVFTAFPVSRGWCSFALCLCLHLNRILKIATSAKLFGKIVLLTKCPWKLLLLMQEQKNSPPLLSYLHSSFIFQ